MFRCFAVSVGAVHNDSTVSEVVGVIGRTTAVQAMIVRCRVYSIHVLTKDSAVTGA